jgi:hypothetical protein
LILLWELMVTGLWKGQSNRLPYRVQGPRRRQKKADQEVRPTWVTGERAPLAREGLGHQAGGGAPGE